MVEERYREQYQIDPSSLEFASMSIWRDSFEMTAVHTAILHEMKKAGYTAPVKTVDRQVALLPQFQENGRFSAARYRQMDDNMRLALWRRVQDSIAEDHFRSDMMSIPKSPAEADFIARMNVRQRSFDMVSFSVDAYPNTEVNAYGTGHPELFRKARFSRISVKSGEREARQILNSVKDGSLSFEEAARTYMQDEQNTQDGQSEQNTPGLAGDMGVKLAYELVQEIPEEADREKLFALGAGEYSDVMQLASGWGFFRVEEAARDADFSDSETLEKVRSYIREFERGLMENWAVEEANRFIEQVKAFDFNEAVYQRGLQKRSFGPLSINYGNVDLFPVLSSVPELSGAQSDERFWKIAFSTPAGECSEPFVWGNNVAVFYPGEETGATEAALGEITSKISDYWLSVETNRELHRHFITSKKMDDRFYEIFIRNTFPGN
jgi:hypothetical protein